MTRWSTEYYWDHWKCQYQRRLFKKEPNGWTAMEASGHSRLQVTTDEPLIERKPNLLVYIKKRWQIYIIEVAYTWESLVIERECGK
jgi:hypothetical protein